MRAQAVAALAALTRKQRQLFQSEPALAEEASRAAQKRLGAACFRHLAQEDLVSIAALGALSATRIYDPARGGRYRTFAFFAAMHAVLRFARTESRKHARLRALILASVMVHLGEYDVDTDLGFETESSLAAKLHGFSDGVLGLALCEVAAAKPRVGGEDERVEREAAALAGDALREVMPARGSDARRMLELRFGEGLALTEVATAMGVDKRGYRTFVRRFHGVLAALREGLARRGIRELPPWRSDISGRALDGDG